MTDIRKLSAEIDALYAGATHDIRVSKSGYSVRVGWEAGKRILAIAPTTKLSGDADRAAFEEWFGNAELWCALVNAWPTIRSALSQEQGVMVPRDVIHRAIISLGIYSQSRDELMQILNDQPARPAAQAAKGVSGDAAAQAGDSLAALLQASFCLRTLLPDDPDAQMTVRIIERVLAAPSGGHTAAAEQEKTS